MKKIIVFLSFFIVSIQFSIANNRDTCTVDSSFKVAFYKSFAGLLNLTGDMNADIFIYDFLDWKRAYLPVMILGIDVYNQSCAGAFYEIKGFYELLNRKPGDFAKSIMRQCLYTNPSKYPYTDKLQQASLGYELLSGEILPKDTIRGKALLAMLIDECPDNLETRILPFWRDSVSKDIYAHRHDSVLWAYGNMWSGPLIKQVLETGNIQAYQQLIKNDSRGELMMLSIWMIDQYKYYPAYVDFYDYIVKAYTTFHKQMTPWTFIWIYTALTNPAAEHIPHELLQRITNDAANVKL